LKRPVLAPLTEELNILLNKISLLIINKDVTSPLIRRIKEPLIYWRNKLYISEWTKGFPNIGEQASQKLITVKYSKSTILLIIIKFKKKNIIY